MSVRNSSDGHFLLHVYSDRMSTGGADVSNHLWSFANKVHYKSYCLLCCVQNIDTSVQVKKNCTTCLFEFSSYVFAASRSNIGHVCGMRHVEQHGLVVMVVIYPDFLYAPVLNCSYSLASIIPSALENRIRLSLQYKNCRLYKICYCHVWAF